MTSNTEARLYPIGSGHRPVDRPIVSGRARPARANVEHLRPASAVQSALRQLGPAAAAPAERRGRAASSTPPRRTRHPPTARRPPAPACPSPISTTTSPGSLTMAAASVFERGGVPAGLQPLRRRDRVRWSPRLREIPRPGSTASSSCSRWTVARGRRRPRACSRSIAPASLGRRDRERPGRAADDVAQARRATASARPPQTNVSRVAPLNRSQPATAIDADHARARHVRAAAGREVEIRRPRPAAARPSGPAPCAAAARPPPRR